MEYFKIFIVTDKTVFKEYCESKLNLDTSIISSEDNDIEVHLVPYTVPYNLVKRYVTEYIEQEYVAYINQNGSWEELTKITLDENDIKELAESNSIIDYEEYKQWKEISFFLIKDNHKFIELFTDKLSDIEKITIYYNSQKAGKQLLYLVEMDDENEKHYEGEKFHNPKKYKLAIKFEHSPVAHIFPETIFNENEILELKKKDFVEKLNCKLHKKYNNLRIAHSRDYILLTERLSYAGPKVAFFNNKYIARTFIFIEKHPYKLVRIHAYGKTPDEAISKLKERIEKELGIKENQKENEQKNTEESIEDEFEDI